ncbi:MAG: hypothetical protein M3N29_05730 [Chloroflexota bacterium]|nr:hypothetical protein [Chloroflexota bacterium]
MTQTNEAPPWDDCLWASGAMLVDKLTQGAIGADRHLLRYASGDLVGGSTFFDLKRGVERLYGIELDASPYGGEPLTWIQLLDRLARGAGAIIAGTYGNLGPPYTRWSPAYASNPLAAGHAMYVDRYDPEEGRMWVMDPLGRGRYAGQWVPEERIWSFIWKRNQYVYAVVTPTVAQAVGTATAAAGMGTDAQTLVLTPGPYHVGESLELMMPITDRLPYALSSLRLAWRWDELSSEPGTLALFTSPVDELTAVDPRSLDNSHGTQKLAIAQGHLTARLELPTDAGLWQLSLLLTDGRGSALPQKWQQPTLRLDVWGERGAAIRPLFLSSDATPVVLHSHPAAEELGEVRSAAADTPVVWTGALVPIEVGVQNTGRKPWQALTTRAAIDEGIVRTELRVAWVGPGGPAGETQTASLVAAAGEEVTVLLNLRAPSAPGDYELHFDVHDDGASYATLGLSTPSIRLAVRDQTEPAADVERNF